MDKKTALQKIKKCLALAKSANEHEAAQALKQAQALMREYSLNNQDIELSDIGEAEAAFTSRPESWHASLVKLCATAFGCEHFSERYWDRQRKQVRTRLKFIGVDVQSQLASYAYAVLFRQLRAARAEYRKTALARMSSAKNIAYRLNVFSLGWLEKVSALVKAFANTPKEQDLLSRYMQANYPDVEVKVIKGKSADASAKIAARADYESGQKAGETAELHRAMSQSERRQLEQQP